MFNRTARVLPSGEIQFSYTHDIFTQTVQINQVLQNSGILVDGVEYGWSVKNDCKNSYGGWCGDPNGPEDYLTIEVTATAPDGSTVYQQRYFYNETQGWEDFYYRTFAPQGTFAGDIDTARVLISGKDAGYWAGYYGPRVRDVFAKFIYRANPCASDPLFDPSCPGYAQAYANVLFSQQCVANPLFDQSCPGYQTAYHTSQCNSNPLYDLTCPGYNSAYFNQQCSLDPLYDTQCNGYDNAFFNQQCDVNPLYNEDCFGYDTAYFDQQCMINPKYDSMCPGYEFASRFDIDATDFEPNFEFNFDFDSSSFGFDFEEIETNDYADLYNFEPQEFEIETYDFESVFESQETTTYEDEFVYVEPENTIPEMPTFDFETPTYEFDILGTDNYQAPVEDSIEREIAELNFEIESIEQELELEMSEPIVEPEIEVVFDIPEELDFQVEDLEEDIEKEIAALEEEVEEVDEIADNTIDAEPEEVVETIQVASEDVGSDTLERTTREVVEREQDIDTDFEARKKAKLKELIDNKVSELTTELENAVTIEQQKDLQNRILALVSFVPDFDNYEEEGVEYAQIYFYPPTPVVDHQFSRWFLNDPKFGILEDSQYPSLRRE